MYEKKFYLIVVENNIFFVIDFAVNKYLSNI